MSVVIPSEIFLAGVLAAEGLRFVVIGSAALWLHGQACPVGDLDVVPDPDYENLKHLHNVLTRLAVAVRDVPPFGYFATLDIVSADTIYAGLDCLLERGRRDFADLELTGVDCRVESVRIKVGALAGVKALRSRYKEDDSG